MNSDSELEKAANAAAEEVLRVIYGEDLIGCAVGLDSIAAVIRAALQEQRATAAGVGGTNGQAVAVSELYEKGLAAIELLATPPKDGPSLNAEELRSLLGERLDRIQTLARRIIAITKLKQGQPQDGNQPEN